MVWCLVLHTTTYYMALNAGISRRKHFFSAHICYGAKEIEKPSKFLGMILISTTKEAVHLCMRNETI